MKKLFVIILALTCLFLASCGAIDNPVNTTTSGTDIKQTTTSGTDIKETTSGKTPTSETPDTSKIITGYDVGLDQYIETESRMIFLCDITGVGENVCLCYYSKADNETYVFCFDPLCDHATDKCFSFCDPKISLTYCNGHIYRIGADEENMHCLYSYNFDGTNG